VLPHGNSHILHDFFYFCVYFYGRLDCAFFVFSLHCNVSLTCGFSLFSCVVLMARLAIKNKHISSTVRTGK